MAPTPMAAPTLRRLAALKPTTIALMHGPTFKGDGAAALVGLAEHYRMHCEHHAKEVCARAKAIRRQALH